MNMYLFGTAGGFSAQMYIWAQQIWHQLSSYVRPARNIHIQATNKTQTWHRDYTQNSRCYAQHHASYNDTDTDTQRRRNMYLPQSPHMLSTKHQMQKTQHANQTQNVCNTHTRQKECRIRPRRLVYDMISLKI